MDNGLPSAVTTKLEAKARYGIREVMLVVAVVLVGIPFGLLTREVTREGTLVEYDQSFANWLHVRVRESDVTKSAMKILSFTGKPIFLILLVGIPVLWLISKGARKLAVFLVVTSLGGGLVDTLVKVAVARPRPTFDDPIATAFGKSFPSGHAMSSIICYGAVVLVVLPLLSRRARAALITITSLWVLGIGVSRLALGVHFMSDVLGGFILGAALLIGSVALFEVWRAERGRPKTHPLTHPLSEDIEPEETAPL